ncbi:hypothetical protein SAMN05661008_00253 [Alkalithermobacter thermoalcaliphilus JW-YL-7 = DSM 7308]|uniref:Uncharacterized protein n=1 Tax=Alkalithermobacter thermoalcaliphilus JW-YL-7 = DSM 7308 TaxID=1121328 RepID=A0A150FRF7_CLOPD|nr:hypothetical protein JWYL7_1269 [[Clostridium] paradoxum JW-YL-7 = DSM 7308]SHK43112.1 hypothetical protein SAMN05661008_00253 [[Clostridium] paradoxum JW-YL-7 = DSM 7308]
MLDLIRKDVDVLDDIEIENIFFEGRKCGVVSCIHCVGGICFKEKCEMYEKTLIQEG